MGLHLNLGSVRRVFAALVGNGAAGLVAAGLLGELGFDLAEFRLALAELGDLLSEELQSASVWDGVFTS